MNAEELEVFASELVRSKARLDAQNELIKACRGTIATARAQGMNTFADTQLIRLKRLTKSAAEMQALVLELHEIVQREKAAAAKEQASLPGLDQPIEPTGTSTVSS